MTYSFLIVDPELEFAQAFASILNALNFRTNY